MAQKFNKNNQTELKCLLGANVKEQHLYCVCLSLNVWMDGWMRYVEYFGFPFLFMVRCSLFMRFQLLYIHVRTIVFQFWEYSSKDANCFLKLGNFHKPVHA